MELSPEDLSIAQAELKAMPDVFYSLYHWLPVITPAVCARFWKLATLLAVTQSVTFGPCALVLLG